MSFNHSRPNDIQAPCESLQLSPRLSQPRRLTIHPNVLVTFLNQAISITSTIDLSFICKRVHDDFVSVLPSLLDVKSIFANLELKEMSRDMAQTNTQTPRLRSTRRLITLCHHLPSKQNHARRHY